MSGDIAHIEAHFLVQHVPEAIRHPALIRFMQVDINCFRAGDVVQTTIAERYILRTMTSSCNQLYRVQDAEGTEIIHIDTGSFLWVLRHVFPVVEGRINEQELTSISELVEVHVNGVTYTCHKWHRPVTMQLLSTMRRLYLQSQ